MTHGVSVLALLLALGTSTLLQAQQQELPVSEVAPKIFVHVGQVALMTRENDGAISIIDTVKHAEVAGSFRRRRDTVGDLDLLARGGEGNEHDEIIDTSNPVAAVGHALDLQADPAAWDEGWLRAHA
jgi:DNA polymerase/3'-5' exonuclease PolX